MTYRVFFGFIMVLLMVSCKKEPITPISDEVIIDEDWLIPSEEVKEGGPGKDGIPSIDDPRFIEARYVGYLNDDERVIAVRLEDEIRVYPIRIMNWHEIVNDRNADHYFTVTYAPLTGTSIAWNRSILEEVTSFGISGLLYENNMLAYDRSSDSYWLQMTGISVTGTRIGTRLEWLPVIETTWETIRQLENVKVLTFPGGFEKDYSFDPYKNYPHDHEYILFPPDEIDERFNTKERVFSIFAGERIKSYPVRQFEGGLTLISENFNGVRYVLLSDMNKEYVTAFIAPPDKTYELVPDRFPIVMKDNDGNHYNFFGLVESGPNKGKLLEQARSYTSYWFAISSLFDRIIVYE